jgi:2-dehydropantoate 2-reductase
MGFKDTADGLPSSIIETTMRNARVPAEQPENSFKPSMLLDVEKSRPIEVEVIIGEVVRLAEQFKVNVPVS